MVSSEVRAEARKKLTGKWGKAAVLMLAFSLISFVLGFIQGLLPKEAGWIISLITFLIDVPLAYGLLSSFMHLYNGEEFKYFDFLSVGFSNFARAWKVSLWILVKMLVPVIVLIVAIILMSVGIVGTGISSSATTFVTNEATVVAVTGSNAGGFGVLTGIAVILYIVSIVWLIIKSYSYQLAVVIAVDNPNMLAKESVEKSAELMQGRKARLFWLELSFIGWSILAVLTFGIGMLWLAPYIQVALIVFYKDALNGANKTEVVQ